MPTLAAALVCQGCAALGIGTESLKVPANVKAYADKVPRIEMTKQSPCWQQRQHAKQEAFLDGTINEKKTVYVADCDMKKPKAKQPRATS